MSVKFPLNHDTPSPAFSHATAGYVSDYSSDFYHMDQVEHECLEHYESNLEKYKDERDAIQKKTFTKWVNKHLTKTGRRVEDLFLDLRDGFNLIALLEALSAETLPKENGYTRFHRIQNVQYCLDFLKKKHIKLVNIRPEDIVEGNGKLTLGLIWTIILNFQVSMIKHRQRELQLAALAADTGYANGHSTHAASSASAASSFYSSSASVVLTNNRQVSEVLQAGDGLSARDALLQWAKKVTAGYPGVNVTNFTNSWRDGLAFNAILHRYRPNAVDWQRVSDKNVSNRERLRNAFDTADNEFGVAKLLDPEDVDRENPDEKSIITYVSSLYNALPNLDALSKYEQASFDYEHEATEWLAWVDRATRLMHERQIPSTLPELERLLHELQKFKEEDMPPRAEQKLHLIKKYEELRRALYGTEFWRILENLGPEALEKAWTELLLAIDERYEVLVGRAELQGDLSDLKSRLARGIGITNEKLDLILKRIEDLEARIDTASPAEIERGIQGIIDDLNALEAPIQEFFEDVEILKQHNDPDANDFHKQVYGLHQRRTAYLDRMGGFGGRLGQRADFLRQEESERYSSIRTNAFRRVEEAIEWVRVRTDKLNNMDFNKDLETLEHLFEQHKLDNHDIQDFQQTVKECIARQAEVSAEDSYEYCELLKILESEYQQLRELSAGRVLDLDSLIAFIRAAQIELVWINEREEIEVTRNWSDINQLDLPMLQNYYKQLLHEIELREKQFNDVYNQGAALINQRHPAGDVIEAYLRSMQSQWDWLLGLSRCLEGHLRDALNLKSFTEEATVVQEWLHRQLDHLENNYNRSDFSLEEGEQYLRELDELKVYIDKYQDILLKLAERSAQISPLWQRGERIAHPIPVTAWCDYTSREITIRTGDECVLLDNSDLIHWVVRGVDDVEAKVPSVVFRIPPPDPRIATLLKRLLADFEKLRKLWQKKHLMVRFNMVLNTMKNIQGWDLDTFLSLTPEQRDEIIKALNDDANKLLSELDPNDPLYLRLQEELKRTNDHFLDLLRQAQRGPEIANQFDEKLAELLKKLEEAWKKLNDRVGDPVPKTPEELERIIYDHKNFEEALQALDPEVSNVKELFRQLPNPTPTQRANMDHLSGRWEDLWDLSRMYVERLKALEKVLQGLLEVEDIVRRHEVTLSSFDDLPSALDKLRGVHSQLLELNMVLQQQEHLVHELNKNVAQLRQHVARTRFNVASHPDVDRLEDQVQQVTVRWDNVVTQVTERLKTAEESQQTQMVYRSQYDEEILWLDRVEATINGLRRPEDIPPEKLQEQLDILMAEYAQLQEHTATIENINKEGGKFIREAKMYDARTGQFRDNVVNIHGPTIKSEFRRQVPQPKNGAQIVTEELEALNRRFAQLSSIILERKNAVQVLIQNWKRKQQESFQNECNEQQNYMVSLLDQLSDVQRAHQGINFDFSSANSAAEARLEMQNVRERLSDYGRQIDEALVEADRLCHDGAEVLTPDQFHALKESRQRLLNNYNNLVKHTDAILDQLDIATSLLIEFSTKSSEFHSWIFEKSRSIDNLRMRSGDPANVNESRREAKLLHEDIMSRNGEPRALAQLASKIDHEIRRYIDALRQLDPNAQHPPLEGQQVIETAQLIQDDYERLVRTSVEFGQSLNRLKNLSIIHDQNLTDAHNWLSEIEQELRDLDDQSSDREDLDTKLDTLVRLNQMAIENQPKIDAVKESSKQIIAATAGTDAQPRVELEQGNLLRDLQNRFDKLNNQVKGNIGKVRSEIAEKDGITQGLANVLAWIDAAEKDQLQPKELPLNPIKLNELKYEHQLKQGEIDGQQKVLADLEKHLAHMRETSPGIVAQEKLDEKLNQAQRKLSFLKANADGLAANIKDVIQGLDDFTSSNNALDKRLQELTDDIEQTSPNDEKAIQALGEGLTSAEKEAGELENLNKRILGIPNVTETKPLTDAMSGTNKLLERTKKRYNDKLALGEKLSTDRNQFATKCENVKNLLANIESSLKNDLEDKSIDLDRLKEQNQICAQLQDELRNSKLVLNELEQYGAELMMAASMGNKRRSVDLSKMESLGEISQQLLALRNRQEAATEAVHDATQRVHDLQEKRQDLDHLHEDLARWLNKENDHLDTMKNGVSLDKKALSSLAKDITATEKQRRNKQADLNSSGHKTRYLTGVTSNEDEANEVKGIQQKLEDNLENLSQDADALENCVSKASAFIEDAASLERWLTSKQRMLNTACSVSADIKLINNQLILLDALKSEFEDETPKWLKMNDTAGEVVQSTDSEPFQQEVVTKTDEINKRWKNLEDSINSRQAQLEEAKQIATNFEKLQRDVKSDILNVQEKINSLDQMPIDNENEVGEYLDRIAEMQKAIEAIRPSTEHLKTLANSIEQLITDPSMKTDVNDKMASVNSSLGDLSKKLDNAKRAVQSAKIHDDQVQKELNDALAWTKSTKAEFDSLPPISSDPQKILEQIEAFNPTYDAIMEKESDMMLIRANVAESLRKKHDPVLKDKLQTLNRTWDNLFAGAKERKQNLDKAKKLSDEFNELKNDVLSTLEGVGAQINAAKEQGVQLTNQNQLDEQLHSLRPKMDGLIALLHRLEELAPGPDTKKLGREIENLFKDHEGLIQELANNAKLNETKNGLRSQFEKEVGNAKSLLESTKLAAGLASDPDKTVTPKLSTDKLATLIKEFDGDWQRLKRDMNATVTKLKPLVDLDEARGITETVDDLDNDHDELKNELMQAFGALQQNEGLLEENLEKQKQLADDVDELEEVLRSMSPIGRNLQSLEDQHDETDKVLDKLDEKGQELELLMIEWKKMADDGIVAPSQANQAQKEMGRMLRQIDRQKLEAGNRKRAISATLDQLDKLQKSSDDIADQMSNLLNDKVFLQPVGSEMNLLRLQRDELNKLKDGDVKQLADEVDQLNNGYKDLIRSAAPGVSTADIEDQLNNVNDKWHELSGEIEKRDNRIESAIQGLGSYNDAYQALLNWLEETEELVNNQKPPSGDYKVVRAQLQNHEFQMKLIEDKQSSVDGFVTMIGKVEALTSEPEQKAQLNAKADEIASRYNALVEGANDRRQQLQDALMLTSEFAELERPLTQWLDQANKRLGELGKIATDPEKLQEQINKLEDLQDEINAKQEPFERLVELNSELAQLIGPDDEAELKQSVNNLVGRYNDLGMRTKNCLDDLENIAENMKSFLDDTDQLAKWLDTVETEIEKFEEISIYPDELIEQSEELAQLVLAVTEKQALVSSVVEDSRELCAHTSGSEAVALQFRIEQLRQRYAQIASEADQRIVAMSEAIPLSEDFCAGYDEIRGFVEGCKEDIDNLDQVSFEDQTQLVNQIEGELAHYRGELDALNNKSLQLQHLSTPAKADELAKQTNELNEEFAQVADQVSRKAERLKMAEKQSRQAFDELDYYIDWFGEARDRIQHAEKPSIDIEFLKGQLRNQRLLNEDIASERAGLRDVIAEASKVARDLNAAIGSQDQVLFGKIEKSRKLAEEAAELGIERLNGLEQAYALCTELDDSYTDLSDWLDNMDEELRNCDAITTGMRPEVLMQQQVHNNQMLQAIYGQKPMVAKFERNVAALTDLCAEADAKNLRSMADEMIERFHELEDAFKERGLALDDAIEQSSRFADRLALFLSNLEGAAGQIRNPEPVSSRPPMLRRQISDTTALLDLLRQKEGAFNAMKEDAAQLLAHTKPDDPAAIDIAEKLDLLDDLWHEIQTGANARNAILLDTLNKAEHFWRECEQCQLAVDDLKRNLDTIQTSAADSAMLQENQARLLQIHSDIETTAPAIGSLRDLSQELCEAVGEDEKSPVEQHLMNVENGWDNVTAMYAQISNNLIDAMDKSMNFHELLQQLLGCLNEFEQSVAKLGPISTTNPDEIRAELDRIDQLRKAIDEQAVMREQLNHSAAELCAGAPLQQIEAVRAPLNDLNYRWNRLYSTLNDREQRLERALLDMGQFNQAYDQIAGWIGKTDAALDEIDTKPGNLKHAEIELCKLRVIQNDIHSHLPSFEAIVKAGKSISKTEPSVTPKLDALTNQWDSLTDKAEQLWTQLEIVKNDANNRGNEIEKWALWVDDILAELSSSRPIGGLPETASAQLDDFHVLKADVESKRNQMEDLLQRAEAQLASQDPTQGPDSWLEQKHAQLKKNWAKLKEKLADRDTKLNIALEDAIALQNETQAMTDWLNEAENTLSNAPIISRVPNILEKQIDSHAQFAQDVHQQREKLAELNNKGTRIQFSCEKKDAIPIKNKLISLRHRFDKVLSRTNDRAKNLDNGMGEAQLYFEAHADLIEWIDKNADKMNQLTVEPSTGERIRENIDDHKAFLEELTYRKPKYEATEKKGRSLEEQAPPPEKRQISKMNEELKTKWNALSNISAKRQRSLDEALAQSGKFDEATNELLKWLNKTLPELEKEVADDNTLGDLETVRSLYDDHQKLMEEVKDRRGGVEVLKKRAEEILASSTDPAETKAIQEKLDGITDGWNRLEDACVKKEQQLSDALRTAVDLDELAHELQEAMTEKENKLRRLTTLMPDDADEVVAQLDELQRFKDGLQDQKPEVDKAMELGSKIQDKCHPKASLPLAELLKGIDMRWKQLNQLTDDKNDKLKHHLDELRDHDKKMGELMEFIEDKEKNLEFKDQIEEPDALEQVTNLMAEHDLFKFELQEKEPEVDETLKANKRLSIAPPPTADTAAPGAISAKRGSMGSKLKLLQPHEKQPRSKRHQKSDALANRWRDLWKHAHDYDEKLKARKAHLAELKRLENFTFDEWRERYLQWNDHGKARISDLFRRIDKSGTGYVPRKAFADGVLASKFPTTPLEMARVADEFDKGDGMISAKEFMNALRFDPKKRRAEPKTETERIHEELARESSRCTCAHRFPITHVSSEKDRVQYGFGFGSTMKRMVRILRSTVMVRVGGGWEELEEFLVKHDPCRAAGRLNVHLRKEITPAGAVDTMKEFKTRSMRTPPRQDSEESVLGYRNKLGPITKIREKTEKSMPMFRKPSQPSRDTLSPYSSKVSSRKNSDASIVGDSRIPRPSPYSSGLGGSRTNLESPRSESRASDRSDSSASHTRIPSLRREKGPRQ